jgi:hypothetical protein
MPRERPEAGRVVVCGGDEQVTERVEHYGLDVRVMRLRERHARRVWRGRYFEHRRRWARCWRGAATGGCADFDDGVVHHHRSTGEPLLSTMRPTRSMDRSGESQRLPQTHSPHLRL